MKKETIIAIVLGVVFGSGVALFLVFNTSKENQTKVIPVATTSGITPVVAKNTTVTVKPFTLTEPEQNSVTNEESILIKGKASKGSLIIIQSPIEYVVKTLEKDEFSEEFPLALGENVIQISVYPKETKAGVQERTLIVYQLDET